MSQDNKLRDRRAATLVLASVGAFSLLVACQDEVMTAPPPPPRRATPVASASASATASAVASAGPPPFSEADFTASDKNRDPFHNYGELYAPKGVNANKNNDMSKLAVAARYALDELKLVAIVTGGTNPRAMFIDPSKKGWIVTLGQFVGRAETVKAAGAGSVEYDLNWKVDRIRANDVVFVRDTPGRTNVQAATRVITLRNESDDIVRR